MLSERAQFAPKLDPIINQACIKHASYAQNWLSERRLTIDRHLDNLLTPSPLSALSQAMHYSVLSPGKRIRSLMTLAVVEYLGGYEPQAIHAACAIEMIHAASLILDDLPCMDNDALRRNRCCTHKRFGEDTTILAAISLLTQSYCTIATNPSLATSIRLEIIKLFCHTIGAQGLSLGQSIDLSAKTIVNEEVLTDMHYLKTGALFSAAAHTGCLIAQAAPEQQACIMQFTYHLGLAFQLMDDVQDRSNATGNLAAVLGELPARYKISDHIKSAKAALVPQAHQSQKPELLPLFADAFFTAN